LVSLVLLASTEPHLSTNAYDCIEARQLLFVGERETLTLETAHDE